jgi:hypothetical protein
VDGKAGGDDDDMFLGFDSGESDDDQDMPRTPVAAYVPAATPSPAPPSPAADPSPKPCPAETNRASSSSLAEFDAVVTLRRDVAPLQFSAEKDKRRVSQFRGGTVRNDGAVCNFFPLGGLTSALQNGSPVRPPTSKHFRQMRESSGANLFAGATAAASNTTAVLEQEEEEVPAPKKVPPPVARKPALSGAAEAPPVEVDERSPAVVMRPVRGSLALLLLKTFSNY